MVHHIDLFTIDPDAVTPEAEADRGLGVKMKRGQLWHQVTDPQALERAGDDQEHQDQGWPKAEEKCFGSQNYCTSKRCW